MAIKYLTINKHRIALHSQVKSMTDAQLALLKTNIQDIYPNEQRLNQQLAKAKQVKYYIWVANLDQVFNTSDEQLVKTFQREAMFQNQLHLVGDFNFNQRQFGVKELDNDEALQNIKMDLKAIYALMNSAQK